MTLSKGPNIVGASFSSPEEGTDPVFEALNFSNYLGFQLKYKVHKPSEFYIILVTS